MVEAIVEERYFGMSRMNYRVRSVRRDRYLSDSMQWAWCASHIQNEDWCVEGSGPVGEPIWFCFNTYEQAFEFAMRWSGDGTRV